MAASKIARRIALAGLIAVGLAAPMVAPSIASARHRHRHHHHHRRWHRHRHEAARRKSSTVAHPTVSWVAPDDSGTVSGTIDGTDGTCAASAASANGITEVRFLLDGARIGVDTAAPYSCTWNTTSVPNGSSHTLKAVAVDAAGKSSSASITVTVRQPDTTPPDTTISSGPSGTITTSSASFGFSASETGSTFQCELDSGSWATCSSPQAYNGLTDGSHTFAVRATDASGNTDPTPATQTFSVAASTSGYPSLSRVDWSGGFDSSCELAGSGSGAWDSDLTNSDYTGSSTTIERTIVGDGSCAAKFVNDASSTMTRAELQRSATGADPELTYEVLAYVPSGQTFPKGDDITQTKQPLYNGVGCYAGGVDIADGTGSTGGALELKTVSDCTKPQSAGQTDFPAGPLPRDQWFAIKVHEKFANDPTAGFVEAWVDPDGSGPDGYTQVVPKTYVDNEVEPSATVRLRIGSYRQATDHTTTTYMDGFRLECQSGC